MAGETRHEKRKEYVCEGDSPITGENSQSPDVYLHLLIFREAELGQCLLIIGLDRFDKGRVRRQGP